MCATLYRNVCENSSFLVTSCSHYKKLQKNHKKHFVHPFYEVIFGDIKWEHSDTSWLHESKYRISVCVRDKRCMCHSVTVRVCPMYHQWMWQSAYCCSREVQAAELCCPGITLGNQTTMHCSCDQFRSEGVCEWVRHGGKVLWPGGPIMERSQVWSRRKQGQDFH